MFGFFNGVGRPRTTLLIICVIALSNALLNQLFIFELGWGIVGSAWATTLAQALGLLLAIGILLGRRYRRSHCTHLTWRPQWQPLLGQMQLGCPWECCPPPIFSAMRCSRSCRFDLASSAAQRARS